MLCIALLSSVVLEEATPAHAAEDIAEAMASFDSADTHAAVDAASSDSEQSPAGQTKPEHHCCPAHCGGATPALSGATLNTQSTISASATLTAEHVLTRAPSGLERPPKLTAII